MKCPVCGLFNPDESERCDCGYDFKTATLERTYLSNRDLQSLNRKTGEREIFIGACWCVEGFVVTGVTYALAGPGNQYLIWTGAIIYGLARIVRGLMMR